MQPLRGNLAPLTLASKVAIFAPSDLANLSLWLKADALSLNDGDAVSSWTDSSGNGRNASQSTASLKPLYKTNIQNNLPVVRFDADDVLAWTQFSVTNHTVFIVHKPAATITAASSYGQLLAGPSGTAAYVSTGSTTGDIANERLTWYKVSGGLVYHHVYQSDIAAAWQILALRLDTTPTVSIRRNGSALTLTSARAFTSSIYPSGYAQLGANVNGDYAELIIYSAALSDTDRAKVETYLAAKYAITLA